MTKIEDKERKRKPIYAEVDEELHREFSAKATLEGKKIREKIEEIMKRELDENIISIEMDEDMLIKLKMLSEMYGERLGKDEMTIEVGASKFIKEILDKNYNKKIKDNENIEKDKEETTNREFNVHDNSDIKFVEEENSVFQSKEFLGSEEEFSIEEILKLLEDPSDNDNDETD